MPRLLKALRIVFVGLALAQTAAASYARAEDGGGGHSGGPSGGGGGTGAGGPSGGGGAASASNGPGGSGLFSALRENVAGKPDRGGGGAAGEAARRSEIKSEQSRARDAVSRGLIQPLDQILSKVRQTVQGSPLSVHLRQEAGGAWIYGFVILSPEGKYRNVSVDATENRILQVK